MFFFNVSFYVRLQIPRGSNSEPGPNARSDAGAHENRSQSAAQKSQELHREQSEPQEAQDASDGCQSLDRSLSLSIRTGSNQ